MENTEILLSGPIKRGGMKRSHLLPIEANYLLDLFCQMDCTCLRKLHNEFKATYYVLPELAPSYDAIVRFFQSHRYSRKIMERRHIMRDEEEIMRYRELISAIRVSNLLLLMKLRLLLIKFWKNMDMLSKVRGMYGRNSK